MVKLTKKLGPAGVRKIHTTASRGRRQRQVQPRLLGRYVFVVFRDRLKSSWSPTANKTYCYRAEPDADLSSGYVVVDSPYDGYVVTKITDTVEHYSGDPCPYPNAKYIVCPVVDESYREKKDAYQNAVRLRQELQQLKNEAREEALENLIIKSTPQMRLLEGKIADLEKIMRG